MRKNPSPSFGSLLVAAVLLLMGTQAGFAQGNAVRPDVLRDLSPSGRLRAAINFGNQVLAQRGDGGEPKGVSADLPVSSRGGSVCRSSL